MSLAVSAPEWLQGEIHDDFAHLLYTIISLNGHKDPRNSALPKLLETIFVRSWVSIGRLQITPHLVLRIPAFPIVP